MIQRPVIVSPGDAKASSGSSMRRLSRPGQTLGQRALI